MTMTVSTATKAAQLIEASIRSSHDPFREIDWSIEVRDDSVFHLPPDKLPLFGTAAWDAMTDTERHAYSRHECASLLAAGIWFENKLMQIVLRHLFEVSVTDPSHRYLLTEVADECRHSMMFGEYIRRAGTPEYAPAKLAGLGDPDTLPGGRAMGYLLILAAEEVLDVCNRATMKDPDVHQVSREIAKLHVLEEARHVSFAKTFLLNVWPTLDDDVRIRASEFAPIAVGVIASLLVNDDVYAELGIADGGAIARANPQYQARIVRDLSNLVSFLERLGVINEANRHVWIEKGLASSNDVCLV
jgi:P-aminobenzoate N-oxygenase AurF